MGLTSPVIAGDCDEGHEGTDIKAASSGCQDMGTTYETEIEIRDIMNIMNTINPSPPFNT